MLDIVDQILTYLRGLWRQRWYALIIAWAVCLGGWLVVMNIPDKYPAETSVFVDTETILGPLMRGIVVGTDTESQVRMMSRTLLTRPNLKQVARMTDLDLRADSAAELDTLLGDMQDSVRVVSAGRTNLFTITYSDYDPAQAKAVVQALLNLFVESSIRDVRDDSEGAEEFLREKIRETEEQLRLAENRLANFKRQNVGTMPNDGRSYYERLEQEKGRLERSKLLLAESQRLRDEYDRQLLGLRPTFAVFSNVDVSPGGDPMDQLNARTGRQQVSSASGLESALQGLLLRYTPNHPSVIQARRQLAEVRAREEREAAAQAALAASQQTQLPDAVPDEFNTEDRNPVYQSTQMALNEAKAQVAANEERVAHYSKRVEELERKLSVVPGIEAELVDLNRAYRVRSRIHEELIERLQSAVITQDAEQTAGKITFRVVEPPHVSSKPDGVNPALMLTLVLAIGLVVALGFALFLSQIFLTFDSRKQLMRATRIPVFGTVSLVLSPQQQMMRWASLLLYLLFIAGLLVVYVLLMQSEVAVPVNP